VDDDAAIARLREARALKERGLLAQRIETLEAALRVARAGLRERETDVRAFRRTLQDIDIALAALLVEGVAAEIVADLRRQIAEVLGD
jgi:hypothetical protein